MQTFDLAARPLRELNATLHALPVDTNETAWEIVNAGGAHAIAVGIDAPLDIAVRGTTGYYCGGMNAQATIRVHGSVGPGVAENMMSGTVIVEGDASQYADRWILRAGVAALGAAGVSVASLVLERACRTDGGASQP